MPKTPTGKTKIVSVVADTPIVADSWCSQVTFGESPANAGWPTTDFDVKKPSTTAVARRVPPGATYSEEGSFQPGDIVAYATATVGATNFFVDEKQGVRPTGSM